MKKLPILFIVLIIISCKEGRKPQQSSCTNWVDSFREFRNAVYTNDRNKIKTFIDFPLKDQFNGIWHLACGEYYKNIPDTIIPFTEQDFDKYSDKLFSKRFINTILKIKSEEFYKDKTVETLTFKEDSCTTYKMSGTFEPTHCILTLNLFSNSVTKDDNGQQVDYDGELSIIYTFVVLQSGQIKLMEIRLAE
jgi:hypothetical protein